MLGSVNVLWPGPLWVGLALQVFVSGCTSFADGDDTLVEDPNNMLLDAVGGGGNETDGAATSAAPPGRNWSCLQGDMTGGDLMTSNPGDAQPAIYTLEFLSLATGAVPAGLRASACNPVDLDCATPIFRDIPADGDGLLRLPLFVGFRGYLEIESDETIPAINYVRTLMGDRRERVRDLPTEAVVASFLAAVGGEVDATKGHVALITSDCDGARAPGVEVFGDKPGLLFYFVQDIPTSDATETAADGIGGFLNVNPGTLLVGGRVTATGQEYGVRSIFIRQGWLTFADILAVVL